MLCCAVRACVVQVELARRKGLASTRDRAEADGEVVSDDEAADTDTQLLAAAAQVGGCLVYDACPSCPLIPWSRVGTYILWRGVQQTY